jgi:hypothetical protein
VAWSITMAPGNRTDRQPVAALDGGAVAPWSGRSPRLAIDLPAVQQEIDDLDAQLATVRMEMRGHLKNLGLFTK